MTLSFSAYMEQFDQLVAAYIPPRESWGPVEQAIYGTPDPFHLPPEEAQRLQFEALSSTFRHHYEKNAYYHKLCLERDFSPQDLRGPADLERIPLLPDRFFKEYPAGRDFALWLANVMTGDLPNVVIREKNPSYDQVIKAFQQAGITVCFSSGTSGRHTFIPRDQRTFNTSEYAISKCAVVIGYPGWNPEMRGYLMMPNPRKTHLYAGRVAMIYFDTMAEVKVAIDREVTVDLLAKAMGADRSLAGRIVQNASRKTERGMVEQIIAWLEYHQEKTQDILSLVGAPYLLAGVLERLEADGKYLHLAGRAGVGTGGGWKIQEGRRIPSEQFRAWVEERLGIPSKDCIDVYGMVEGNGWMTQCPEGHYFHIPTCYFKPMVLDKEYKPLGFGQWGRFAFLDAAATSYPGFMVTGDLVKMLERCPVCDRTGPVLEPEVRRAVGEEMRGCGEEVRNLVSFDLGS